MAHEAHHDSHHTPAETKPTTSYRAAFWFVIILAGLFVAAVNFVNVMGHDEGGHGAGHETHEAHGATAPHATEPAAHEEHHTEAQPAADSTAHEAAHH
jgi:hypothetical protein